MKSSFGTTPEFKVIADFIKEIAVQQY